MVISRITFITSVLKISFDWTNFSLSLNSFYYSWLIALQFNQYKLLLFLWFIIFQLLFFGFSVIIFCVFGCWLFTSHWSDQRSFILKLVCRCVIKWSVGHIQSGLTDFLPLHGCGILWRGCWLGVQTCSLHFIALLDINSPSSSYFNPSFVDFWLACIIFIGSAFINFETCPQVW